MEYAINRMIVNAPFTLFILVLQEQDAKNFITKNIKFYGTVYLTLIFSRKKYLHEHLLKYFSTRF